MRHGQRSIPLCSFSRPGLSNHDDYLVFGELSRILASSQVSLRGPEAGSDLPSWTSDRRWNTHHFVKLGHLGINRKFFSGLKDFLVLGRVRFLIEWVHVPVLRFYQFFVSRVSCILAYQGTLYLFGSDPAWHKAIERLFGDVLGPTARVSGRETVFGRGHGQERSRYLHALARSASPRLRPWITSQLTGVALSVCFVRF